MKEPKAHVVGFVAAMLFVAGVSTAVERATVTEADAVITIEQVGDDATPSDDPTDVIAAETTPEDGATPGSAVEPRAVSTPGAPAPTTSAAPTTGQPSPAASTSPAQPPQPGQSAPAAPAPGQPAPSQPAPSSAPAPAPAPSSAPPAQPTYPEAPLYDDAGKVRGITDTEILMCGHAALALGAAFDTSKEDLNVYWDMVNEGGGINGRKITMTWEDDAYASDVAVRAATTCSDKNPFMILGGIGFDQIPGVRNWAEANNELYLHHIAVAPEKNYNYSYSLQPTVQLIGQESGNYIARQHAGASVGVIYRDSANWKPGSDAGIAVMETKGLAVSKYPVVQNQGVYAQELNQMKLAGTEVVWIWENALNAAQILNQADEIEYYPTWVVFPFQTTIDILSNPTAFTIEGVATWMAYAPGGYGGAHASYGVDTEIAAFEAAYAKYRPGTTPNDILWQVWVGNKILEKMFVDCGPDCNRNRFAGMMLSGYQGQVNPGCAINFKDPRSFGGHHGGFSFFTQDLFVPATGPAYRTRDYCVPTLA